MAQTLEEPQLAPISFQDACYTGPDTVAGRYLRTFWHPVYLARDLPAGKARRLLIMNEEFTLYRGQDGTAHIIAPRCAHRGTVLWTGWVEGDCVRCFYHGWKYDGSGQCVEAPAEREGFAPTVSIRAYPTQEYLGLIFAYLGEGEPPPLPRFPELEKDGLLLNSSYIRDCNYINNLESNMDHLHTAFVHRTSEFSVQGLNRTLPDVTGEETDYGIMKVGKRPDGIDRVSHFFWPNALQIKSSPEPGDPDHVWSDHIAWRVPVDDVHHVSFMADYLPIFGERAEKYLELRREQRELLARLPAARDVAYAVLRGELHTDDVADRPDIVNIQDYVAQVGQGVIPDYANERLGRSDVLVSMYRRIWVRELSAFAAGEPRKRWSSTGNVSATTGV